MINQQYSL